MILLTGGSGFVGRHLIAQCAADARPIRVLARAAFTDEAGIRTALTGVDTVIHTAGVLAGRGDGAELHRVNADGTARLARCARDAGVRRFIHLGTAGVYGEQASTAPHRESDVPAPTDEYSRSKLAGEQALLAALDGTPVHWTILRPPGLYGADRPETAALFREVAQRWVWFHGPSRVILQPTHVADLVRAVVAVLDRPEVRNEVLNIGGDRALSYQELIALVATRVGRRARQLSLPAARVANRSVSIEKARRVLSFEPTPLERGLDRTADELRRAGSL